VGLIDEVLAKLGAVYDRAHLFSFAKDSAPGVHLRFTRDLRPLPETGLTGGHLLELEAVLDERHPVLDTTAQIRFDVLEEDFLLFGGLDDRIVSLLGTGAQPPETGAPVRQLATQVHELPDGLDVPAFVEEYKRTVTAYENTLLVVTRTHDPLAGRPRTPRTHVLAWLRVEHDDIGAHSELYFVLDVAGAVRAASPVLELEAAPPGVAVRVRGLLDDAAPLDPAVPEPLGDVPVTLGGRRAVTGAGGDFVIDARLPVGDHPLAFARSGIDPVTCTVRVSVDAQGRATAAVLDPQGTELVSATTPAAATEQSVVALALPGAIRAVAHKLRGTVLWPDSRPGDVAATYHGTPLAERRVYVLPVSAGVPIADARPKTTREWEELKRRPAVLRSSRPGRPEQRERTDADGRFEVRYVDFSAGNRFLIWVERFDPLDSADTETESPDFIVRAFRQALIDIRNAALTTFGRASVVRTQNRNLVDHDYARLTGDCVPVAVDALRIIFAPPTGPSVARPPQTSFRGVPLPPVVPSEATRQAFETSDAPLPHTVDLLGVPASKVVDGLELLALPLVPVFETPDAQSGAARRAAAALAAQADATFTDYADIGPGTPQRRVAHERGAVRLVVDTSRLDTAIDFGVLPGDPLQPDRPAQVVHLLESTFVVRPQLGALKRLGVEQARWHFDAVSLADNAFVRLRQDPGTVSGRTLVGTVHPMLAAVSPLLPGLAPRRVYLAPGHGLFPRSSNPTSANPAHWETTRGGYAENAGEDEVDLFIAAETARILEVCGARGGIRTCRELFDVTLAGVRHMNTGSFDPVADADFPRLCQQNPFYYFGAQGVTGLGPFSGDRDSDGIMARTRHMRLHALTPPNSLDVVVAQHTNALGKTVAPGATPVPAEQTTARGIMVEYLNVFASISAAGALSGEGNPLGLGLATRLRDRIGERLRIRRRGVERMGPNVNAEGVRDLFGTYHHWAHGGVENINTDRLDHRPTPSAGWTEAPFLRSGAVLRIPVALAEHAFHDNRDDARLLGRTWFRRLAAEGAALAIDAQLQSAPGAPSNGEVKAVLRRTFGETPPVRALPDTGAATPASIAAAVRAVGDPAAPAPAGATAGAVAEAALSAARALTRQGLVDAMRDALRLRAGWEAGDAAAVIEAWVTRGITGGRPVDRPGEPATRADAAALASGVAGPGLLRAAAVADGQSAFLGRVEADALVARLAALGPRDTHRVADAFLADGSWSRLDDPGDVYELESGTPVTVLFRTSGVPWKTAGQTAVNGGVADSVITVEAGGRRTRLTCLNRTARLVASGSWFVDLPPGAGPLPVTLELHVRHRSDGWRLVGFREVTVRVRALPAT
jgi:hypothetical protein